MTETTHTETTRTLPPYPTYPADSHPAHSTPEVTAPADPWLPPTPPPVPDRRAGSDKPRRGVTALIAIALAAGLIGGGAGAAVTAALDDQPTTVNSLTARTGSAANAAAPAGSVEQVAAKVLPSVVSVTVQTAGGGGGEGTGVILSSDGLILTNNHVVSAVDQGADLTVAFNDGRTAKATLVGRDPTTDLAVIKATGVSGLTPATLGDSSQLRPGQEVVAIGSPLGLQGTVTSGIVSALNRPVRTGGTDPTGGSASTVIDAIQTDAAINPGNSGGPLVNMRGEVVGINSAIATLGGGSGQSGSIGLGFSIPVNQARSVADQLTKSGKAVHAQLGVSVSDIANGSALGGAGIQAVTPGGSAAKAGVAVGDVVTKVGNRSIDSADALIAAVRSYKAGDKVTITYERGGNTRTTTVTLGSDA
ncbi:MAG: trypsin-like peptidase domain-containing protein [Sporichthyaceae bacterium]